MLVVYGLRQTSDLLVVSEVVKVMRPVAMLDTHP